VTASDLVHWGLLTEGYGVVNIGDIVTGLGIPTSPLATVEKIGPGSSITLSTAVSGGFQSGASFAIQLLQLPILSVASGTGATITAFASPLATIGGLSGMTPDLVGQAIAFTGFSHSHNNGNFTIEAYISPTSVKITNSAAISPDSGGKWSIGNPTFSAELVKLNPLLISSGSAAGVLSVSGDLASIVLDSGVLLTNGGAYVGNQITLGDPSTLGAANPANSGSFMVISFTAGQPTATPPVPPTLQISNPNAVAGDFGSGTVTAPAIGWTLQPSPTVVNIQGSTGNLGVSIGDSISDTASSIPSGAKVTQVGPGLTSLTLDKVPTSAETSPEFMVVTKVTAAVPPPTPWNTTVDTINPFPLFLPPNTQSNALGFTTESYVSGGGIPYSPPEPSGETFVAVAPTTPYTSFTLTKPSTMTAVQAVITVFVPPTVQVGWTVVLETTGASNNTGIRRQIVAVVSTSELTLDVPFPTPDDTCTLYRIDNPLNTYNGTTLTLLNTALTRELNTLYAEPHLVPTFPPYQPNVLNEQQSLIAFFDTVFTTIVSSSHGQVMAGFATLTDNTVDFLAAEVNTSYLVYVEYPDNVPPFTPLPAVTASTELMSAPADNLYFTPVPAGSPVGVGTFTTGMSPDPTLYIQVGDSIIFTEDGNQTVCIIGSVTAPMLPSTPGQITLTAPYEGTTWSPSPDSNAYNLNVLSTTDALGGVSNGDVITGPGIPNAPPTTIVSFVPSTSIRLSASTSSPPQLNASYVITATGTQFANMGVYGIGTVVGPTVLTLTFVTPAVGFAATMSGLKYKVVSQFGTSLATLQGIFTILSSNAAFIIATTTFQDLITTTVPVLIDGVPATALNGGLIYANGINDLVDDLGNRNGLVNSQTGRLSYLDPTNPDGPVSIIETALNTTDQLYAYRYAWINARINLQSGYLVLLNLAIASRTATQVSIFNSLIQLLTVQGS
jgi:hypothetical protein